MHKRLSVLLALLFAVSASAQSINYLTFDSSVTVSGFAQAGPGPANNYSASSTQDRVAGEVSALSPGAGPYGLDITAQASSRASGSFFQSGTGIQFSAMAQATTSSRYGTWGGGAYAEGTAHLITSFSVCGPMAYALSLNEMAPFRSAAPYGAIDFACSLSSVGQGWLGGWSSTGDGASPGLFSGLFEPGETYTFEALVKASADLPDPLGQLNSISLGVSLAQVREGVGVIPMPEPSAGALCGCGVAALALLRRRQA